MDWLALEFEGKEEEKKEEEEDLASALAAPAASWLEGLEEDSPAPASLWSWRLQACGRRSKQVSLQD